MNIYLEAAKRKLRFSTQNGMLSVEDLFDLPLESKTKASLNSIAIQLDKAIETSGTKSFIGKSTVSPELTLAFDIVKDVIDFRLEENRVKLEANKKAQSNAMLDEIIAKKEQESLSSMSLEELKALRNS